MWLRNLILLCTTAYHFWCCRQEDQTPPPGTIYDIGDCKLHLYRRGRPHPNQPTVILDHSLGGVEGYLLIDDIAEFADVCIYDRAGYGWSSNSPNPRNSGEMMQELEALLRQANISPPYILVGDSLGSYTMRLYAHTYPDQVAGLILTDGLHEDGLARLPASLQLMKAIFTAGFLMSVVGSFLGFIRIFQQLGLFQVLSPRLRQYSQTQLAPVLRSFVRPKHWFTMAREMFSLNTSHDQLSQVESLGSLPVINIKASHFFTPTPLLKPLPLEATDELWTKMHRALMRLSTQSLSLPAQGSHFVWVDQPEAMLEAIDRMLLKCSRGR
ncbi:alpha/beta hydrolase [Leptolyngbya cf. ectocarpi LEGE 11479]|uniref:Alpha/beta hydrolase n=1 Tax=Leptolyngbya cf. ectocarpi LEGE 11479 TaxID=1828722 RepID=A0A929FCW4_LEPEC|nr:alpha/beta hydrolase [Leptolyngbya ectocarpi]MBE9070013.1 alpha/beta hydrolase [Leptolyngbya cf. ectocarpi LEGE 11479]